MQKGEIWISDFDGGKTGYLIGDSVEPNVWGHVSLIKVKDGEYTINKGGRVSSRIDPSAYYTGEGQLFESEFSKFHHKVEGIKIIPKPDCTSITESSSNLVTSMHIPKDATNG